MVTATADVAHDDRDRDVDNNDDGKLINNKKSSFYCCCCCCCKCYKYFRNLQQHKE